MTEDQKRLKHSKKLGNQGFSFQCSNAKIELSRESRLALRRAFRELMRNVSTGKPFYFNKQTLTVLKKEFQSEKAGKSDSSALVGFEFVRNGALNVNLLAPIAGTIDSDNEDFRLDVAPFMPMNIAGVASGTSHVKMVSIAAELDFDNSSIRTVNLMSAILPWEGSASTVLEQCHLLKFNTIKPLFVAVGMVCYRERSGVMFALKNGRFNPLTIANITKQHKESHES